LGGLARIKRRASLRACNGTPLPGRHHKDVRSSGQGRPGRGGTHCVDPARRIISAKPSDLNIGARDTGAGADNRMWITDWYNGTGSG